MANKRLAAQSGQAAPLQPPVTAQYAAGAVEVSPAAPIICAAVRAFRQIRFTADWARNAAPAAAPIHSRTGFRPRQNIQVNAPIETAASTAAVFRTNWISPGVRARSGPVPIQLSRGVRSKKSARAAMS